MIVSIKRIIFICSALSMIYLLIMHLNSYFEPLALSFCIGSISISRFCIPKIRSMGSGNIGASNAWRVGGFIPAVLVFGFDFLKGYLFLLIMHLMGYEIVASYAIGIVCGHIFGAGGKGIATMFGVTMFFDPLIAFFSMILWIFLSSAGKIASISSLVVAATIPLLSFFFSTSDVLFHASIFWLICTLYAHRKNIVVLLKSKELEV